MPKDKKIKITLKDAKRAKKTPRGKTRVRMKAKTGRRK